MLCAQLAMGSTCPTRPLRAAVALSLLLALCGRAAANVCGGKPNKRVALSSTTFQPCLGGSPFGQVLACPVDPPGLVFSETLQTCVP